MGLMLFVVNISYFYKFHLIFILNAKSITHILILEQIKNQHRALGVGVENHDMEAYEMAEYQ